MTALPYPYVVFYEATQTEIIIHAIRHAARNPSGMPWLLWGWEADVLRHESLTEIQEELRKCGLRQ